MNVIAIIPARGGSERIPRKNVLPVAGKPLIAYSIEHALNSKSVTRTVVSTDDDEIAGVSEKFGAEVIRRPPELAVPTASSESALVHVLDVLKQKDSFNPDLIVFLQCTSPARDPLDIDRAIETLVKTGSDSLFSACRWNKLVWRNTQRGLESLNYDYKDRKREQEFPEQYMENGSIYVFKPWVLRDLNNRLGGKISVHEMDFLNSFQVDSAEDLELIELVLKRRLQEARLA